MKKEKLIEKFLQEPVKEGDIIYVRGLGSKDENAFIHTAEVKEVHSDHSVGYSVRGSEEIVKCRPGDYKKYTGSIGANTFPKTKDRINSVNFTLESVLFKLGLCKGGREERYEVGGILVKNLNWNPFVFNSLGQKEYYQRDFVWSEDDKRLLIDSIYNNIDCGKILIRQRGFQELEFLKNKGETQLFWNDVVDGKQRLKAISDFIDNQFPDSYGNYYEDMSNEAQHRLTCHQLFSYSEFSENTPDSQIINQFLKLNFTGVPQSKEHIDFVKEISKRL